MIDGRSAVCQGRGGSRSLLTNGSGPPLASDPNLPNLSRQSQSRQIANNFACKRRIKLKLGVQVLHLDVTAPANFHVDTKAKNWRRDHRSWVQNRPFWPQIGQNGKKWPQSAFWGCRAGGQIGQKIATFGSFKVIRGDVNPLARLVTLQNLQNCPQICPKIGHFDLQTEGSGPQQSRNFVRLHQSFVVWLFSARIVSGT